MAADHGSSPAAWTTVTITVVGFTVGAFALVFGRPAVVVASGGIIIAGLIVGKIMQLMGLGARGDTSDSSPPVSRTEHSFESTEPEAVR